MKSEENKNTRRENWEGNMAIMDESSPIWEEIDRAENYLVCCMYDEAASLASTILKQLLENHHGSNKSSDVLENFEDEQRDLLESAGMVLVQSMKQLRRTSEILKELKLLFGSITLIPVQVFVSGVCFQLSEGLSSTAQGFLEEFVNSWMYVDDQYYPLSGAEARVVNTGGSCLSFSVSVDEYLEVVELYVVRLLAATLNDTNLAISWVEKAVLPMEKRQVLLRRLQSMSSTMISSSQSTVSPQLSDVSKSERLKDRAPYSGHQQDITSEYLTHEQNNTVKSEILKLSRNRVPYFRWFPTFNLKLGSVQLSVPSGKLLLALLILIMCYITRKKQAKLKRFLAKHALSLKKALLDLWQLAFSYQVNPLAAVQTMPNSTRGNR